jgi:hypothetical protein
MRLERLTYVHDGDPGVLGQLIQDARGIVRFGNEGSGLLDVERPSMPASTPAPGASDLAVRIVVVKFSALPNDVQAEIGEAQVPCVLAHSGLQTIVLLPPRSLGRVTGGMSDLRGKLRFGLARVGWQL